MSDELIEFLDRVQVDRPGDEGKPHGTMVSLGKCHICKQEIIMSEFETELWQEEVFKLTRPLEIDEPIYGIGRIIPLPPYPCNHVFEWVQRCYKKNDKFIYQLPPDLSGGL